MKTIFGDVSGKNGVHIGNENYIWGCKWEEWCSCRR